MEGMTRDRFMGLSRVFPQHDCGCPLPKCASLSFPMRVGGCSHESQPLGWSKIKKQKKTSLECSGYEKREVQAASRG